MRLHRMLCTLGLCLLASPLLAGSVAPAYYSELDGSFNPGLPGRVPLLFDQPDTQFTDLGINAFSDPVDGRITSVALVDINQADANLVGIGLARHLYTGALDTSFHGTGKRVKDAFLTSVVDACRDPNGRIVVAGMTPGANGSGGNKDLALVRFNADGSDDLSFAGDGGVAFTLASESPADEFDETIRDVDCLANGNILIGGSFDNSGNRYGFVAEMPSNGSAVPVRAYVLAPSAGDSIVVTMANEVDLGIVVGMQSYGTNNYAYLTFLSPNGAGYVLTPGRNQVAFGLGSNNCSPTLNPQFFGVAQLGAGDYVFSGLRYDGANNVPFLARLQYGEQLLTRCSAVDLGVNNAYVTPPVVLADRIFVAAGFQPFGSGPLTSRLRGYLAPADGSAPVPLPGFGVDGLAQWSYPFHPASANNNRSFVQRLFPDPAYGLMAVGSRTYNGNDTDLVLARFGSGGVFNNGFETTDQ